MKTNEAPGMGMAELQELAELTDWLVKLKCNSFSLSRNDENAPNYMSVARWIEEHFDEFDLHGISPGELEEMKRTDTLWTFQLYPDNPSSFFRTHGATVVSVLRKMKKGLES